jgi:hypothetical protein
MNMAFRQKDFKTAGLLSILKTPEFHDVLDNARHFRNKNQEGIRRIYRIEHEESQDRQACHAKKRDHYPSSNINAPKKKTDSERKKKGEGKKSARKRSAGELLSRHEGGGDSSDSDMDSEKLALEDSSSQDSQSDNDQGDVGDDQEPGEMEAGVGGAMEEGAAGEAMEEGVGGGRGAMEEGAGGESGRAMDNDDDSDVSSSFSVDSDDDVPLNQLVPRSKEFWRHPFPNPESVSVQEARKHPWKLNCVRHLIMNNEWKKTVVEAVPISQRYKGKPPKLMRMDGLKFLLVPSTNRILYLFHSDFGLELIHVEKLFKNQNKKLCVKYTRVLSTAQAERQCKSDANHSVINGSGVSTQTSLGALALQDILVKQKRHNDQRTIFHRGDFPFETSVENLVGFVPWESACDSVVTKEIDAEDPKSVLDNLNAKLSLAPKLTSMSEVDLVYLGSDFSEVDGK